MRLSAIADAARPCVQIVRLLPESHRVHQLLRSGQLVLVSTA